MDETHGQNPKINLPGALKNQNNTFMLITSTQYLNEKRFFGLWKVILYDVLFLGVVGK